MCVNMSESTLLENGFVFTMDSKNRVLENFDILIQDGKISSIERTGEIRNRYRFDQVIDATNKAIIPGLISTHFHSHIITRGLIDSYLSLGLQKALEKFYYPILEKATVDDIYFESLTSYGEALKSGITCVNDMYTKMEGCAKAAEEIGIRASLSEEASDLLPGQPTLSDNENLFRRRNNTANKRITVLFGVEWIPVCSSEFLFKARELADKYKTGIHVHLCESLDELKYCSEKYRKRPTEVAFEHGILGEDVVAAHFVWPNPKEVRLIEETKTHISHCIIQNLKCGNGISPIDTMIQKGINVSLGTDAYTNDFDMFQVMKYASLIQKVNNLDPSLIPPQQSLKMATINGARALHFEKDIGSIEVGKKADLCLIDLDGLHYQPLLTGRYSNLAANLIYSGHCSDVETVFVDGKRVVDNHRLVGIDETKVKEKIKDIALQIFDRAKIL